MSRAERYAPPPKLTVSEWADRFRYLSNVDSSEPGKWRTSRAPYLKGIMDAATDPDVEGVVIMSSAQVGKTQCLNNVCGFFIHQDPSPIMVVQPTKEDAEEWSKDRFMRGMVNCTPALAGLVVDVRQKGVANTIAHKEFPNGQLTVAWSNSKSRLASRPVRVVLLDEVDKYATDPGPQGDPVKRAINRSKTFWNRKWIMTSTPTLRNISAIERAYLHSDQRRYYVYCPHCEQPFVLDFFKNIRWDKDAEGNHLPETAHCVCLACGCVIEERDKAALIEMGRWIPENPGGNVAGFHINELYSSLGGSSWAGIAKKFIDAKGDTSALQNFYNETLGETWELQGETVENSALYDRREVYAAQVPVGAVILTGACDVQDDRLELLIKGWGVGEESWDIEYRQIFGDPATDEPWAELDALLMSRYARPSGLTLPVSWTFVDSGGHHTSQVYEYCRQRWQQHVFACKGRANAPGSSLPVVVGRPSDQGAGIRLWTIGVDTTKATIYNRLRLEAAGPGYFHFPRRDAWDEDYFRGLTAEKLIVKHVDFRPRLSWIKMRQRNEPLDLQVYALAALKARNADLQGCKARVQAQEARKQPEPQKVIAGTPEAQKPAQPKPRPVRGIQQNSWVNSWR
jgi:phage terminase large subunit GpA-like protein